jgi:phage major head subunit gpT-like protein
MAVQAAVLAAANTTFRALFTKAFSQAANRARQICMVVPSTARDNVYGWLAALPAIQRVVGEYARKKLEALGYRLTNEKFGGIIDVPQEDFDDDQLGIYAPAVSSWGERAGFVPDTELLRVLVNGFDVALGKDYTGSAFFAANKKAFPKTKFPFTNKDTKKLSVANFQTALAALQERVDAEGVPLYLGTDPSKVFLVVTATDRALADSIVTLQSIVGAGGVVAANPNFNKATVMVYPGLETLAATAIGAGALPWFLLDCSKEVKPFILQEREAFALTAMTNPQSQQVFDQDKYSWKVKGRMALGYGLPEMAWGSDGSAAAA